MRNNAMHKICYIASTPMTINAFFKGHIVASSREYSVHVVSNISGQRKFFPDLPLSGTASIGIERRISPIKDLKALFQLIHLFRQERFYLIHSATPKAGLLSMIAGWIAGIPVRVHIFTGQVWATRKGISRAVLKAFDRIIAACCTHILVDSPSQRQFLLDNGVIASSKSRVLGKGSICGVDSERFHPNYQVRHDLRVRMGIAPDDTLFLFIGRLVRDKGVLDLAHAFVRMADNRNVHLAFVGSDEESLKKELVAICSLCNNRLHFHDHTDRPEDFMAAADALVLPSYREGFGMVVIEAASVGIPAIASKIYGVTDAIEEGATGLLFPPGDCNALEKHMIYFAEHATERSAMGSRARRRAHEFFSAEEVSRQLLSFYREILSNNKR